jgi:hypothetical protein
MLDIDKVVDELPEDDRPVRRLRVVPPGANPGEDNLLGDVWGKKAPENTADLERIIAVPRRPRPTDEQYQALVELVGGRLRLPPQTKCVCKEKFRRQCITHLNPIQAWALYEAGIANGLLGIIVVGGGKTALGFLTPMVVPDCKSAVLLVPPKLVDQLKNEYQLWAQHWKVPSLLCPKGWGMIQPGRPAVHVIPTSQLSRDKAAVLLETLKPDLIIIDEAHKFRYPDTARTSRLLRYFAAHPATNLCAWSGSLTDKSIKDYAHLAHIALGPSSPLPLDKDALSEWSMAIDPPAPGQDPAPPGALVELCSPGETLRDGYRRRLLDTRGVVATDHAGIGASLPVYERDPGEIPDAVDEAIRQVRSSMQRPDGEELIDAFSVSRCARELASGFYYRWTYPRGEPVYLIEEWLRIRKDWHAELRRKLEARQQYLDSPMMCAKAAVRYYQEPKYKGPMPTWRSQVWPAWREIRDQVKPKSEAVWIDDYLARDAAEWGLEHNGIIWYEHSAFGRKVAELSGLPVHAGGVDAEARIKAERGDRSIIASLRSHGEGRDGLQFLFHEQLVANPPVSRKTGGAGRWEQLLGRLHRQGQQSDEVITYVYRHTWEMREAWDRALELARYVTGTMGSYQKLLACAPTWELL